MEGSSFGISFHGDNGTLIVHDAGYTIYDMHNKSVEEHVGKGGDAVHLADFLKSIRENRRPQADILTAHKTTLLCHLGNIAYRTGHSLKIDPKTGHIQNDPAAQKLWAREYRPGWEPKV